MTTTIPHVVNEDQDPDPRESDQPRVIASDPPPERKVSTRSYVAADVIELCGSMFAGACLAWLVFFMLLPLTGLPGFVIQAYLSFLVIYAIVERQRHGKLAARDRLVGVIVATVGLMILAILVWVIATLVVKGLKELRLRTFTDDLEGIGPLSPTTDGGILHAIIGSFQQVGLALILAVPLAISTAVFLHEIGGPLAKPVRTLVNAMSGVPSILAGLFILAIWITQFNQPFSGFAGALALAIMMMPSVTRTTEEVLRLVPGGLREASLALGAPEWRTSWKIVLPTARAGVITAVILGLARAVGETAPLLLTTFGGITSVNANPFNGPQESLPLLIWESYRNSQDTVVDRGWTAALVLVTIVLVLFTIARIIGNRQPGMKELRKRGAESEVPSLMLMAEGKAFDLPPEGHDG